MAKPAIIAVDDDPQVLRAVEGDLSRHYSDDYRVVAASSGAEALEVLEQLKLRDDEVALFVVDQRMPEMTGVEFLERAEALFPRARRTLLTAYADTEAAIQAINRANLDYYILKPWDPPEEKLYPILDDLLDDWVAGYRPPFEGVRVIEHRWSPRSHDLKAFLARNQVPYIALDAASDEEAQRLLTYAGVGPSDLPVVLLPDGGT
ncbi:MAG TPA: response regulator, partial [Nitriliruptorales bacterium]|nr:response regulator [Nitriliruptorales bacterium]